jgi:hypothetical protein
MLFLHTICRNCDFFRSNLIIFRDRLVYTWRKACVKSLMDTLNILKFVRKIYAGGIKFVRSRRKLGHTMRILQFYGSCNGSCKEDVKFIVFHIETKTLNPLT